VDSQTSSSQGIDSSKGQKKQTSSEFESSQNNSENSSSLKEGKEEAKQSYMSSSSNKQSKCAASNSPGIYQSSGLNAANSSSGQEESHQNTSKLLQFPMFGGCGCVAPPVQNGSGSASVSQGPNNTHSDIK